MPTALLNNHHMHYEIHGSGDPLFISGGWGSFCHGGIGHIPVGLTDRYQVIAFDHRGLAASDDDPEIPATTGLYAEDVIALATHLGIERAHFVGIVGIGACIFQEVAIRRPDLVRSLVNSGCWARVDPYLATQMDLWLEMHEKAGFEAFQRFVVVESFRPDFFAAAGDRLLGPDGGWKELRGNVAAHRRLTEAAKAHDTLDRLGQITAPTLVFHNGTDRITGPRLTRPVQAGIPGAVGYEMPQAAHVVTGRDAKAEFARALLSFLATK